MYSVILTSAQDYRVQMSSNFTRTFIRSFIHDTLTTSSNEEICIQDFLVNN